jgi:lysozyme
MLPVWLIKFIRSITMREAIAEDLIRDEGLVLHRYICPTGYPTIGVGRNLDSPGISEAEAEVIGTQNPEKITEQQAQLLLKNDISRVEDELLLGFPWSRSLNKARYMAIVNMVFQLGITRFRRFRKTIAHLEAGRWEEAADEMLDSLWARQTPARAGRQSERIRTGRM